jgi:hypothetical protein
MLNMFKDKRGQTIKSKPTIEVKTVIALVNMVDVNVTTQNKTSQKHVFKDREPRRIKIATDWEVEEKLKKFMVETMQ